MSNCYDRTNGRINITGPNISELFAMYDKNPVNSIVTHREAYIHQEPDQLTNIYFTNDTIKFIQSKITEGVATVSKGQINVEPQNSETILMIMRGVYLREIAYLPKTSVEELKKILIQKVLDYAIPQVYNEAISYHKYIHDASTLVVPLDKPQAPDTYAKTLELKHFF